MPVDNLSLFYDHARQTHIVEKIDKVLMTFNNQSGLVYCERKMTRKVFTSKLRACRMLVVAGVVWIGLLIGLHHYWNLVFIENVEREKVFAKTFDEDKIVETFEQTTTRSTTSEKVEMDMNDIRRIEKLIKVKERERALEKRVTPVPLKYLEELGLNDPGENGQAVILPIVSPEIQKLIDKGWKRHEFNEFVSDLISLDRTLPDVRGSYCMQDDLYLENLPSTSVIIIFHNEAWSTLLRSVHSVLNRSPEELIHEIILVDDFSNMRKT